MENLHEKEKLEYMNHALTEVKCQRYNDWPVQSFWATSRLPAVFFEEKKKEENLLIMFADMDKLKHINDHYGHEYGDEAIKLIAGCNPS